MTEITVSSPTTQKKRPADFTGIQTERLNEQKKVERAAAKIAMVNATDEVTGPDFVDYSGADIPLPEIEVREVEVNNPYRAIRVNTKIENMTFGRKITDPGDPDNGIPPVMGDLPMYNFDEGKSYRVPKAMAEHLGSKGYLSYIGN
jgi:hypothetical protein